MEAVMGTAVLMETAESAEGPTDRVEDFHDVWIHLGQPVEAFMDGQPTLDGNVLRGLHGARGEELVGALDRTACELTQRLDGMGDLAELVHPKGIEVASVRRVVKDLRRAAEAHPRGVFRELV